MTYSTSHTDDDLAFYAQLLLDLRQNTRALSLVTAADVFKRSAPPYSLANVAASALIACGKLEDAQDFLDRVLGLQLRAVQRLRDTADLSLLRDALPRRSAVESATDLRRLAQVSALRATLARRCGHREAARTWGVVSLCLDPLLAGAADALLTSCLVSPSEATSLASILREAGAPSWAPAVILLRGAPHDADAHATAVAAIDACPAARQVPTVLCARASALLHRDRLAEAETLLRRVERADRHHPAALQLRICAAHARGDRAGLFRLAHEATEAQPGSAVALFAAGSFRLLSGDAVGARPLFAKASAVDPGFAPAWLALGAAFSAEQESEQAVSAYRAAGLRFPGSHLPQLYRGAESVRAGDHAGGAVALLRARALCPQDPAVHHELAVLHLARGRLPDAVASAEAALRLAAALDTPRAWWATHLVLGHAQLRAGALDAALAAYRSATALCPASCEAWTGLGTALAASGRTENALTAFHSALDCDPDDAVAREAVDTLLRAAHRAGVVRPAGVPPHASEHEGYSDTEEGMAALEAALVRPGTETAGAAMGNRDAPTPAVAASSGTDGRHAWGQSAMEALRGLDESPIPGTGSVVGPGVMDRRASLGSVAASEARFRGGRLSFGTAAGPVTPFGDRSRAHADTPAYTPMAGDVSGVSQSMEVSGMAEEEEEEDE